MRYSKEHKRESRDRIVEAARFLFRQRGFDGASIDQVMNEAGLTRGAFYAHFDSKDDLIRDVLEIEAGLVGALRMAAETDEPLMAARTAFGSYLAPANRADTVGGCPLVAHPGDAIRGDSIRRDGYTARLQALVESVESCVGDGSSDDALLISVLAVGGALLSGASSDPSLADRIEKVCLEKIEEIL